MHTSSICLGYLHIFKSFFLPNHIAFGSWHTHLSKLCACNSDCSDLKHRSSYNNHNNKYGNKDKDKTTTNTINTNSMGQGWRKGGVVGREWRSGCMRQDSSSWHGDTVSHPGTDERTNHRIWKPNSLSILPLASPSPRWGARPGAKTGSILVSSLLTEINPVKLMKFKLWDPSFLWA